MSDPAYIFTVLTFGVITIALLAANTQLGKAAINALRPGSGTQSDSDTTDSLEQANTTSDEIEGGGATCDDNSHVRKKQKKISQM